MPTYEYECLKCGHNFELFQKISDAPDAKCPECRARAKRLISSGCGIIFKGTGFYATDYRKKTAEPKNNSSSQPCSKTGCDKCANKVS